MLTALMRVSVREGCQSQERETEQKCGRASAMAPNVRAGRRCREAMALTGLLGAVALALVDYARA